MIGDRQWGYETRDFALLIDFLLKIVRPWTLHEVDYYAAQFFTDLLPDCITDSSMDYLKKFTAAYLHDDIRWSWPEAQPALRAAFRVLLQADTYSGTEMELRDTPPGDATLIPYVTSDRDHLGFAGLTGLMRSLLVAINVSAPTLRNNKNTYSMSWPTWLNLWAQESAPPLMYHVLPEDADAPAHPKLITSPVQNNLLGTTNLTGEHHLLIKRLSPCTAVTFRTWTQGFTDRSHRVWPEPDWETDLSNKQLLEYHPHRNRNPLHQCPENPVIPRLWYITTPSTPLPEGIAPAPRPSRKASASRSKRAHWPNALRPAASPHSLAHPRPSSSALPRQPLRHHPSSNPKHGNTWRPTHGNSRLPSSRPGSFLHLPGPPRPRHNPTPSRIATPPSKASRKAALVAAPPRCDPHTYHLPEPLHEGVCSRLLPSPTTNTADALSSLPPSGRKQKTPSYKLCRTSAPTLPTPTIAAIRTRSSPPRPSPRICGRRTAVRVVLSLGGGGVTSEARDLTPRTSTPPRRRRKNLNRREKVPSQKARRASRRRRPKTPLPEPPRQKSSCRLPEPFT